MVSEGILKGVIAESDRFLEGMCTVSPRACREGKGSTRLASDGGSWSNIFFGPQDRGGQTHFEVGKGGGGLGSGRLFCARSEGQPEHFKYVSCNCAISLSS